MEQIRVVSECHNPENGEISLRGFIKDETAQFLGAIAGCSWVKVENGRLQVAPALEAPPAPARDETVMPHWLSENNKEGFTKRKIFGGRTNLTGYSPGIFIQSLCGYHWTHESYRHQVETLESFGFECMRSRRGVNGKFWEVWYLPGLWAAKGKFDSYLKNLKTKSKKRKIEKAVDYLCHNVSFGTLDVVVQRAAMIIE